MRMAALPAVALLLAGCEMLPSMPPDWVVNRNPLPSCGEEVLGQGQAGDGAARTCLLEAFQEGRPAELISTQSTIEGDPITRYLRVHENGVVEIFVDGTRDRFGSGHWERMRCQGLVAVEEASAELPAETVFLEDRCELLPAP